MGGEGLEPCLRCRRWARFRVKESESESLNNKTTPTPAFFVRQLAIIYLILGFYQSTQVKER